MDESHSIQDKFVDSFPELVEHACRRCRKFYDVMAAGCPVCGASNPLRPNLSAVASGQADRNDHALITVCLTFGLMLAIHALWGAVMSAEVAATTEVQLLSVLLIDSLFLVITLIAWWKTRSVYRPLVSNARNLSNSLSTVDDAKSAAEPALFPASQEEHRRPVLAWLLALPLLAVALSANYAYHIVLANYIGISADESYIDLYGSLTAAILLVCLEPALIEEFYFRGVAWNVLRTQTSGWGTVFMTSVMFAMAHIGVPLSVPALFIVGLMLGCVRLWSGGLLLPMILHFLHNLYVILYP